MIELTDIKNKINKYVTASRRIGVSNDEIKIAVADYVRIRGPIGTGKYACSCNNFSPRWIEDSLDGCCPGCFAMAQDIHYEVPTSKLDPNRVTREMIMNNTWGINVKQLDKNRANRLIDKALAEDFTELPNMLVNPDFQDWLEDLAT